MQLFIHTSAEVESGADTHDMVFATSSVYDLPQSVVCEGSSRAKRASAAGARMEMG